MAKQHVIKVEDLEGSWIMESMYRVKNKLHS